MVKIWKYKVPGHCEGPIKQVLQAHLQYGEPVVWVVLDDQIKEVRGLDFFKIGTGWELTDGDEQVMDNAGYCGTVKDEEGYIWHVFCVAAPVVGENKGEGTAEENPVKSTPEG